MTQEHLDDEFRIAEERVRAADRDTLALQQPIGQSIELATPVSVSPATPVSEAVQLMVTRRLGCLLVTDEAGILLGLFTERDVLTKVVGNAAASDRAAIGDLMTKNPDSLTTDSPLVFALHRMSIGGYRHVPLLDEERRPVAVISMRDIVDHLVDLHPNEVLNLPPEPDHFCSKNREGG